MSQSSEHKQLMRNYRIKQIIGIIAHRLGLIIALFWSLFPVYWVIVFSFRQVGNDFDLALLPKLPTLDNYTLVFNRSPLVSALINSSVVGLTTVILSFVLAVSAAYAIARIPFRGKQALVYFLLLLYSLPTISFLTGLYQLIDQFQLINSLSALVICYTLFTLPFAVWLFTSFIQSLPYELEEAAQMDGYSPFAILFRVVVPLLKPATASFAMLAFIGCWNEFLFALSFLYDEDLKTLTLLIPYFSVDLTSNYIPFTVLSAACVVAMIPLVGSLIFGYRYIISGITMGAVKG